MPTYLYFCKNHGEFEAVHSINSKLEECPLCKENNQDSPPPERLISPGGNFILVGSGWAKDRYG